MNPQNLLGPSWLPKLGGIIAAIGTALRLAPTKAVADWSPMLEALGLLILGQTVRQNNVSSEQAGAKPADPAAAAGAGALKVLPFLLILPLMFGCASGIFTTKNIATLAKEAAYQGAKLEIQKDPSTRAAFETGSEALKGLLAAKDYNPDHFAAAIRALKINELKSKEASIAVSGVVVIWSAYAPEITALDEEQKVLPILTAVEEGLTRALDETQIPKP